MRLKTALFVTLCFLVQIHGQKINTEDVEIIKKINPDDEKLSPADDPPLSEPPPQVPSSVGGSDDLAPPSGSSPPIINNSNDDVDFLPQGIRENSKNGKIVLDYTPDYDPMTSWYAPPNDRSGPMYVLPPNRLEIIRRPLLYPFYNKGGDSENDGDFQKNIHDSEPQLHKNLNFQLPFFGFRFNYTRISINGYLEFSDPPRNYKSYPLVFPVKDFPRENDPGFIGIFHTKARVGALKANDYDRRDPGVYFRLERDLRTRSDQMGVEIRERVKWDMREGIIGADNFDPKHAIIVTWKNVSFSGGIPQALYRTNTFQMVLATDEVFTYAMFNYAHMDWTTHTEARGDTTLGEGGIPAFIGFNAGNGTRSYEYKPYSQASVIRDVISTGWGNNKQGRHLFRIDENVFLGSCNKDIDGANLPLVFAPESGNMLGGTVVNITGPCFKETDQIVCKFDTADEVYGVVVDTNRAICVQPPLKVEGYVKLEIQIGPGAFKWKGKYYVETPATATQKIFFDDMNYNEKSPPEIGITWEKYNLTANDNANIRISLWGYRETRISPEFLFITDLAENVQNSGRYKIIPSTYKDRNNQFLEDLQFGFIQINLTESITVNRTSGESQIKITPLIWSRPIPLGWYFGPQWERKYGKFWPKQLCDNWLKNDRYLKNFAHELPQCPCTLQQALADKGRYLPDFDCDKEANPKCYFHRQAVHCVKSGSPSLQGAEQQCCYDKNHYLMLSYDQKWGSFPRRSHNLGYIPYYEPTKVPTLSQWFNDMIPRFVCCLWQEDSSVGCETLRFERRPSQDCVAYQGPAVAGVYGDPHMVTFDDLEYTFNGKGEFVLVRTESVRNRLEVQGRFEQMPQSEYGEVRATQLTSVVARGNYSTTIEIRSRPKEARWRYHLDVIADGKRVYFDRPSLKYQHFPGVTVYTPPYIYNQSEVIVMFDSGAGVEVVENDGFLTARVYLPWSFINQTRGLFGNWSFDVIDDLTLPDGTVIPPNMNLNDMQRLYTDFGSKWMLDDTEELHKGRSLFNREFGKTAASYNNRTFLPEFQMDIEVLLPANRSEQKKNAYIYCTKDNYQCLYDYAMTNNRDAAHFSTNYKASIWSLKEISRESVVSCGVLEQPRFGRKDTFLFVPGTKVTFECNQDFTLVGDNQRECLSTGKWNIPDYGYTECLRQQEYSSRQAAKTGGIILAVLIPIILIIVYLAYSAFKKMVQQRQEEKWEPNAYDDDDADPLQPSSRKMFANRPVSPLSDGEDLTRSPAPSDGSSTSSLKKPVSYDKSYRTHEPLEGLPETDFDADKKWDLEYEPETKPDRTSTVGSLHSPKSDKSDQIYAMPNKTRDRFSSQSSIVTDV